MTDRGATLDRRELCAYLDGELDGGRRAAVEAHLAESAGDAALLAAWRRRDQALRAAFASDADAAVIAPRLARRLRAARRARSRRLAGAAAAAVLILMAGAGLWRVHEADRAAQLETLAQSATVAYRVYAASGGRASLPVAPRDEAGLGRWLSAKVGRHVWIPDLGRLGYHLADVRLVPDEPGPAAQLVFDGPDGRRIACYFVARTAGGEPRLRYVEVGGVGTFYGIDDRLGYAVSGNLPRAELLTVAEAARQYGEARGAH